MRLLLNSACIATLMLVLVSRVVAIDAVPEPGLLIYGQVFSQQSRDQTVAIGSITWNSAPGGTGTAPSPATYPAAPTPISAGSSTYVARIPYESPNPAGLTLVGTGLFDLSATASDPHQVGFSITPQSGGAARVARIKAVNGLGTSGDPATWPTFYNWNDITTAKRGGVVRLDLVIDAPPSGMDYETWIQQYFPVPGDPRASPDANPDGDPFSNAHEFAADTHPNDATRFLRVLTFAPSSPTTATISWTSNAGQSYVLERSASMASNSWTVVGTFAGNAGQTVVENVLVPLGFPGSHWRVRTSR